MKRFKKIRALEKAFRGDCNLLVKAEETTLSSVVVFNRHNQKRLLFNTNEYCSINRFKDSFMNEIQYQEVLRKSSKVFLLPDNQRNEKVR